MYAAERVSYLSQQLTFCALLPVAVVVTSLPSNIDRLTLYELFAPFGGALLGPHFLLSWRECIALCRVALPHAFCTTLFVLCALC